MAKVLSNFVTSIPGFNPSMEMLKSMTLAGTNTYMLGVGTEKILIDSGEGKPEWIHLLKETLGNNTLKYILFTHSHIDHIGGVSDLFKEYGLLPIYKRVLENEQQYNHIEDNQIFELEGMTLRAIYTPGHSEDHVSFYFEEEKALFSGDIVLGRSSVINNETSVENYPVYLESMEILRNLEIEWLYPAHGEMRIPGNEEIELNLAHRLEREEQVYNILTEEPADSYTVTKRIYGEIDETIFEAAERNVKGYLKMLKIRQRACETPEGWTLFSEEDGYIMF